MALADIFAFLADPSRKDPLRDRLDRALTVVFVPMLNPDGAELFQRQNAAGIDINRDARKQRQRALNVAAILGALDAADIAVSYDGGALDDQK
jgi:hypothetical protein